ncbi:hypothetical protein I5Q34_34015 [Streptomyces sp. AV19]|uniref:hypothetical protein n=1 Tax=Streptomyces sp. AV19 TaxID=2793068 RepID=UPI0018FE26B9|nr:hypothetical protein [Streptomyces sp. AV19]MBH1939217.1 hypothetical protein [Streptomyces sp. AV19]MDG4537201.1 hypothetical protein [Streptomyces sp. AV19]
MSGRTESGVLERDGASVTKRPSWRGPYARIGSAMTAAGAEGLHAHLQILSAAGVRLPDGLVVLDDEKGLGVRHQWVAGPTLPELVLWRPRRFAAAVAELAAWVSALAPTDARIDTNLTNVCVLGDGPVLVDVLPPLIPSLRPTPVTLHDQLFDALCFHVPSTLYALVAYSALRLRGCGDRQAQHRLLEVAEEHCGLPARPAAREGGPFPCFWFRARALAAVDMLSGAAMDTTARAFLAYTSTTRFAELAEDDRAQRIPHARRTAETWGWL